jgi:hypothetical protein
MAAEDKGNTGDQGKGLDPPNVGRSVKRVEVLVDNLGPDLLKRGRITDDPRVVSLLKTQGKEKLVHEVK